MGMEQFIKNAWEKTKEAARDPEFQSSLGELKRRAKDSSFNILFKNTADGTKKFTDKAQKIMGKKNRGIAGAAAGVAVAGAEETALWMGKGALETVLILTKTVKMTFNYLKALAK